MSNTVVSFNNADSSQIGTTGAVLSFDVPKSKVTMQCFGGGASMVVWLQLSLDGVNFSDVAEVTASTPPFATSDQYVAVAARARLANMTAGNAVTAIIGVEPTQTGVTITQS